MANKMPKHALKHSYDFRGRRRARRRAAVAGGGVGGRRAGGLFADQGKCTYPSAFREVDKSPPLTMRMLRYWMLLCFAEKT